MRRLKKQILAMGTLSLALVFSIFSSIDIKAAAPSYTERVVSFNYYENSIGLVEYYGIVEITNTGSTDIYLDNCVFNLIDNDGNVLQSDGLISSCKSVIGPGEVGYFYNSGGNNLMDDDLDLSNGVNLVPEVTVKEANGKPHLYPVSDDALYASALGYPTITGVITNDTDKDISYMYINFIFYDSRGNIIGINGTGITNVAPGDTKIFSDGLFYCDKTLTIDNIARYDVIAEESYYQW